MNNMTTVKDLRRIPGVRVLDIYPHGECLIVPENQFKPGWIESLESQGQRCTRKVMNSKAMVLVKLEVGEPKIIAVPATPPKQVTTHVDKVPLASVWFPEPPMVMTEKTEPTPVDPPAEPAKLQTVFSYSKEEDDYLLSLYNQTQPQLSFNTINAMFTSKFPKRAKNAACNRLHRLIADKNNKLALRGNGQTKSRAPYEHRKTVKKTSVADDFIVQLWNENKSYTEISEAVKEKYPDVKICTDARIFLLQTTGQIIRRQVHKSTKEAAPAVYDNKAYVTLKEVSVTQASSTFGGHVTGLEKLHQMEEPTPVSDKEDMLKTLRALQEGQNNILSRLCQLEKIAFKPIKEGELEKQLFKKIIIPLMANGGNFSLNDVTILVSDILDAVKKEFPMELWNEDNHNITEAERDKLDCECNRQTLQWYKKWIGDLSRE
jgi:hypothetical protein